jgi:ribosomal protein S18 acetylase RimI-like enzyme
LSEEVNIEIRDYDESMAAKLADMYNSWDDLWPGGFTSGVPYDKERVREQYEKMSAIAILIAWDMDADIPAGSCTLHTHWRDEDAAYIGVLGASPEYLGKKVGKKLLLRSVSIATQEGFARVDLNTWPGNMRAMPLYKKIGLMWNPEGEGVHMEDYVPSILTHRICQPFFSNLENPNAWYELHERELEQAPDDYEVEGMKVYPYRFQRKGSQLEVTVDRYARGITAIKRVIDGSSLSVDARVAKHLTLCGIPSIYSLELTNGQEEPVQVDVHLSGFEGLEFSEAVDMNCELGPGESLEWTVPFVLTDEAPLFRPDLTTRCIETQLKIDGEESRLRTGLVIKPAAEVIERFNELRVGSGGADELVLTAIAADDSIKRGTLHINCNSDDITLSQTEYELDFVDGISGATVGINVADKLKDRDHDLWAWMTLQATSREGNELSVTTRRFRVPVYCLDDGDIAFGFDDREHRICALSADYRAYLSREGAILRVSHGDGGGQGAFYLRSEIGPPFGISPFRFAIRESETGENDCERWFEMSAIHHERPVRVIDRVVFEKNSGIIRREVWAENLGDSEHTLQVRIGAGGGISLGSGKSFVPLKEGILEAPVGSAYSSYPSAPNAVTDWAEGWVAYESAGHRTGMLWDLEEVEEIRLGMSSVSRLGYPPATLTAREKRCLGTVYLVMGASGWKEIRSRYRARVLRSYAALPAKAEEEQTDPLLELETTPVTMETMGPVEIDVLVRKLVNAPMIGSLEIVPPQGWSCELIEPEATQVEVLPELLCLHGLEVSESAKIRVRVNPDDILGSTFGIHSGRIRFKTNMIFETDFHILVLGDKSSETSMEKRAEQGKDVYHIDNGLCKYRVSPDYGGCLISLETREGTELLVSSFPEASPKPGGFLENYYGGVQPLIFGSEPTDDITKAPTNREKMSGRNVQRGMWKGVSVEWKGVLQRSTRGVDFCLEYLTTAGSPLILIDFAVHNRTSGAVNFMPSLFVDAAFDGSTDDILLRTEWEGQVQDVRPSNTISAVNPTTNFFWIRNGSSQDGEGLGLVTVGVKPSMLGLIAPGLLITGAYDSNTVLRPGESRVFRSCLLVNPSETNQLMKLQDLLSAIPRE